MSPTTGGPSRSPNTTPTEVGIEEFSDLLLTAPGGVALLHALESEHRSDRYPWEFPADSRPDAASTAVEAVATMSFGQLVSVATMAAENVGGPWKSDSTENLSNAHRLALHRRPLAEAIADRFTGALGTDLDLEAQEWWTDTEGIERMPSVFADLDRVYCCGEFPWRGLWTVGAPPPEVHSDLVDVWEMYSGDSLSRWRLPVVGEPRVWEIHRPDDWIRLVATYPARPGSSHSGWELPGPNQHRSELGDVVERSDGAAGRTDVRVAMPDWSAVGRDVDAVHLSWAGMIACEGHVVPVPSLGSDVVTMLRYWRTERTLWLNDRFGRPEPMPAPELDGEIEIHAISVVEDIERRASDRADLVHILGRDPFV